MTGDVAHAGAAPRDDESPLQTWLPRGTGRAGLIKCAHAHASDYSLAINQDRTTLGDDERAVVNWLRHAHTDYDHDPTQARHRAACAEIATAFPWLEPECTRQIEQRASREAFNDDVVAHLQAEQEAQRAERQALVADSRQAIRSLHVGQRVRFSKKGRNYTAKITKKGRSKVTLEYRLKSQELRTALVYAALVDPESSPVR